MNEEGAVVLWELINFTSQDKIQPVLNDVKFKLKNKQISYIYNDAHCNFSNVYEQCFPRVSIKLNLFHATQWITKVLLDKKYWEAIDFSRFFGLIFRNSLDAEDLWNQITENPATIMRNFDDFMKLKDTYMKQLPVNKIIDLLSEIKNLRKHVEKGCVYGIPTGGGIENNERLFKSKIKVAEIVSTVLFYVYNSRISNGNRGKIAFYSFLPLQKSSADGRLKKVWILLKMMRIPEQTQIILWRFTKVLCNYVTLFCKAGENVSDEGSGSKIY